MTQTSLRERQSEPSAPESSTSAEVVLISLPGHIDDRIPRRHFNRRSGGHELGNFPRSRTEPGLHAEFGRRSLGVWPTPQVRHRRPADDDQRKKHEQESPESLHGWMLESVVDRDRFRVGAASRTHSVLCNYSAEPVGSKYSAGLKLNAYQPLWGPKDRILNFQAMGRNPQSR